MAAPAGDDATMLSAEDEAELNSLVREYLGNQNYKTTATTFDSECRQRGKPNATGNDADVAGQLKTAHLRNELLTAIDRGHYDAFQRLWDQTVPAGIRYSDPTAQKLMFYVQILFAVQPYLNQDLSLDPNVTMARFRSFLETRGAQLSKTPEFLPFYALPFVPDLRHHTTFQALFAPTWASNLRERLDVFLRGAMHASSLPRLYYVWTKSNAGVAAEQDGAYAQALQQQIAECEDREMQYIERHHRVQREYHALLGVTAELVEAMEKSVLGHLPSPQYLESVCSRLNVMSSQVDPIWTTPVATSVVVAARQPGGRLGGGAMTASTVAASSNTGGPRPPSQRTSPVPPEGPRGHASPRPSGSSRVSPLPPAVTQSMADLQAQAPNAMLSPGGVPSVGASVAAALPAGKLLAPLDYGKITHDLFTLTGRNAALLLQALRWRLARSRPGPQRAAVVAALLSSDVLGVRRPPAESPAVVLPHAESPLVREYATRLLNCLASIARGRSYLVSNPMLLAGLFDQMQAEGGDTKVRQNLLGVLQKLSLLRSAQSNLIDLDMIAWLTETLEDLGQLSEYSVEYSAALLMNLCLRTAGRVRASGDAARLLRVLAGLLGHDTDQVRTYIHGALYSLLALPRFRATAANQGLEQVLRSAMASSTPEMAQQLHYVLDVLVSPKEEQLADPDDDARSEDGDDDVDEEDDALEQEEMSLADREEGEALVGPPGEAGEALLCTLYAAAPAAPGPLPPLTNARPATRAPAPSPDDALPSRPVTPKRIPKSSGGGMRPALAPDTDGAAAAAATAAATAVAPSAATVSRPGTTAGTRPPTAAADGSRPGTSRAATAAAAPAAPTSRSGSANGARGSTPAKGEVVVSPSTRAVRPSDKALAKMDGNADLDEYASVFGSRAKVPRTPEH